METQHIDVLVVGAGISGISAAYHLQTHCPNKTYAILEAREALGGTWDLFRYPGIRSDSDMYTLGFSFRPWTNPKAIADGPAILDYLQETAREFGIDRHMRFGRRVKRAQWSSTENVWTVEVAHAQGSERYTCNFLFTCAGYYRYEAGYTPDFPGVDRFEGRIVHPQHWTDDIEYAGKRVIVIGSGATAVTLVPELAQRAELVTMLQRSPTYMFSAPEQDRIANWLRTKVSAKRAYAITRWKNVILGMGFYNYTRRFPQHAKKGFVGKVREALNDGYDVDRHFAPSYNPWDQRVCLVPEGDLFDAINEGRVSVVTDHIESFTEQGILLRSGEELQADLIVTATGLDVQFLGGMEVEVDGRPLEPVETMTYKGMMLSDVPNFAFAVGYTNASWTLKCDLTSQYVCRLINYMDARGKARCMAQRDPSVTEEPLIDFTAGYIQRALDRLPRQGSRWPWKLYQNYIFDTMALRHAGLEDGVMKFA